MTHSEPYPHDPNLKISLPEDASSQGTPPESNARHSLITPTAAERQNARKSSESPHEYDGESAAQNELMNSTSASKVPFDTQARSTGSYKDTGANSSSQSSKCHKSLQTDSVSALTQVSLPELETIDKMTASISSLHPLDASSTPDSPDCMHISHSGNKIMIPAKSAPITYSLPKQLFFLSTIVLISLTLYMDRGIIGATLPSIKSYFPQLTSLEQGLLGSSFLFGYMFSSLFFAEMASWVPVKYLMMIGCAMFVLSNVLICSGLTFIAPLSASLPFISSAHSRFWFYYLLVLRLFVSIGEAAIIPLSFSLMDDLMANSLRTFAVTALSLILPVGIATGFAISGAFHLLVGDAWWNIFWVEIGLMLLFGSALIFFPGRVGAKMHSTAMDALPVDEEDSSLSTLSVTPKGSPGESDIELHDIAITTAASQANLKMSPEKLLRISIPKSDEGDVDTTENISPDASPFGDHPLLTRENSSTGLLHASHKFVNTPSISNLLKLEHSNEHNDNAIAEDVQAVSAQFEQDEEDARKYTMCGALANLFTNKMYLCICLSGITYTFVLGSFIFWGPTFIVEHLSMELSDADLVFSVVALVTGVLGPLTTGIILQRLVSGKKEEAYNKRKKTLMSFICSCVCIFIGATTGMAGFILPPNRYVFFGVMTVSIFFLLAAQSPLNLMLISCVPKGVRTHSMSIFIFLIHLMGDFPSPMGFGLLKDMTDILWAMRIFWVLLGATFVSYILGTFFAVQDFGRFKRKRQLVGI